LIEHSAVSAYKKIYLVDGGNLGCVQQIKIDIGTR